MDEQRARRTNSGMNDEVLTCVMHHIDDPKDRDAISLVCRRWYEIDALTRKHVTIALCYATRPDRLTRRFRNLESLKLKGMPRAAMFNLIPDDWGGYATPWANEIAQSFNCLKFLHFRRMIVRDSDLQTLAQHRGRVLLSLKLDKCSGFSTDGLLHVGILCRNLRTLFLEESSINERDGIWLHELAVNNSVLETLNFYLTELSRFNVEDLELIARNCRSLVSVKISECEILDLAGFFRHASALKEFGGGSFNERPERYANVALPPNIRQLGLTYLSNNEIHMVYPLGALLTKLDLLYSFLETDDICLLIQRCPNLEVLETRNVIGDRGLELLAQFCQRLKRLRVERGGDGQGEDDEGGAISQTGLIALAQGCLELEYLAVYVSDITNAALVSIGTHLRNLCDFRLVLLDGEDIPDLPLDEGVRALLMGCERLRRFAFYVRQGGLTDVGLGYIGRHSQNIRWMLLGFVGQSDAGLIEFSRGCPNLQKLEMRGCCFSENAIARAVLQLTSLRYLWVQGYRGSRVEDLHAMARPFWNIELIPARRVTVTNAAGQSVVQDHPAHILAYYSLVGPRNDFPDTVVPLVVQE